jgi:hypothetical protein
MLVANWREVLRHAWSVRLLALAAVLSGLEVALPFLGFLPIPAGSFALLSGLTTAAAFIARLVAQKQFAEPENHYETGED